jgi:hypothetical protein
MKKKKDKWVIVDEIVLTIRAKETMQQGSKRELSLQINAIRNDLDRQVLDRICEWFTEGNAVRVDIG